MTDREVLLIAYGYIKAQEDADPFMIDLIADHLAVEISIEKREKELDKKK